ncbi:MAG: nucleotidyltransferase domain-containing protein [Bacteroidales bacterium]|nr:nucleotidyltransferase domain-containing protein [Bacteroidales bacterium]
MNSQIFNEIRALKRQILPNEKVILFGSQARGDAHEDSDWDLLVLLDKEKKAFEDEDTYGYPFAEMGLKHRTYISVKMYTAKEWDKRKPSPFYKNVEHDGIEII